MSRLPIQSGALTSSLLVAASVLAAFWLVSLSFNYELPTLISCAALVPSGMLLGSLRRLLLHGAVILVSTLTIWNTPWIWIRVFLLPAPDRSIAEPVLL